MWTAIHILHRRHVGRVGQFHESADPAGRRQNGHRQGDQKRKYKATHFHSGEKIADLLLPGSSDEFASKELVSR